MWQWIYMNTEWWWWPLKVGLKKWSFNPKEMVGKGGGGDKWPTVFFVPFYTMGPLKLASQGLFEALVFDPMEVNTCVH